MDLNMLGRAASAKDFRRLLAVLCFGEIVPSNLQRRMTKTQKEAVIKQIQRIVGKVLPGTINGEYRDAHDIYILLHMWDNREKFTEDLGDIKLPAMQTSASQTKRAARQMADDLLSWMRKSFEDEAYAKSKYKKTASAK